MLRLCNNLRPSIGDRRNSHLLGYETRSNDYFETTVFRASPADLGDLGYGMYNRFRKS